MTKVAFIVQRCGLEVNGGAEVHCHKIAKRMSFYWEVEILTTCALDYITWENYYSPGVETVDSVNVRRFRVAKKRNIKKFNKLSDLLRPNIDDISINDQEIWMRDQGPWSPDFIKYIKKHKDEYDFFIFFTYLYATTYFILPLVKDKAFLAPLAHDEWPIYFSMWNKLFEMPKGFIFNTEEEKKFLMSRFPKTQLNGPIVGVAVDNPERYRPEQFKRLYSINKPFLLYIGRIDPAKGCEKLINFFVRLKSLGTFPYKLVLLGKPTMEMPKHPDIISPGFVEEQTKWDALSACEMLVVPSLWESLSIVLLEAWSSGRPALVNGGCPVLVDQCRRAQGGLWYTDRDEFRMAVEEIAGHAGNRLGQQGKKFVKKNYSWPVIEKTYLDLIRNNEIGSQ